MTVIVIIFAHFLGVRKSKRDEWLSQRKKWALLYKHKIIKLIQMLNYPVSQFHSGLFCPFPLCPAELFNCLSVLCQLRVPD